MKLEVGRKMTWIPAQHHVKVSSVTVVELRKRGHAKLSNGWVVNEYGFAEGTERQPGGRVIDAVLPEHDADFH